MKYKEYVKTKEFKNANDYYISINGGESINDMYFGEELKDMEIIGIGHLTNNKLWIDLVCEDWDIIKKYQEEQTE